MTKRWIFAALLVGLVVSAGLAFAHPHTDWLSGTTDERFDTLATIQPGLGTVMIEYANRMGNVYYAAQAGNWGMAAYQLSEATEMQEVGETTRPSKAAALKAVEDGSLKPLAQAIIDQDFSVFDQRFSSMVESCNACHVATGHDYISYQLPAQASVPAKLDTGQTFTKEELEAILSELNE